MLCAWARRDDDAVDVYSADLREHSRFDLPNVARTASGAWPNYVRGVVDALARTQPHIGGLDLAIAGDVPQGAGLSSSAALEVAVAGAFRDAFDLPLDDVALAQLCQRAENEYVGVQCGIMDQFASALSRRDYALLIDCRSLAHEAVPLRLAAAGLAIVIANSAVRRELIASAYNDRRRDCEQAVAELRLRLDRPELASLRDVSASDLERAAIDTVPMKRARHVVTEIARVAAAVDALKRDDFEATGRLMVESHVSLRDDYEVSSRELDLLVDLATAQDVRAGRAPDRRRLRRLHREPRPHRRRRCLRARRHRALPRPHRPPRRHVRHDAARRPPRLAGVRCRYATAVHEGHCGRDVPRGRHPCPHGLWKRREAKRPRRAD